MGIPKTLYRQRPDPVGICRVPSRRLDDRIRELCRQAVVADDTEFASVLSELRGAMHEHIEHLRKMAIQQLAGEQERRNRCVRE
jgi:hypothetical protein